MRDVLPSRLESQPIPRTQLLFGWALSTYDANNGGDPGATGFYDDDNSGFYSGGGYYAGTTEFSTFDFASISKALNAKRATAFTSTGSSPVAGSSPLRLVPSGIANPAPSADRAPVAAEEAILSLSQPSATANTPVFEGAKWSSQAGATATSVITWSFASSPGGESDAFSGYLSAQYQATVEQAFQAWSEASGLVFQEVPDSASSDIRIGWGSFDTQDSGVLGLTNFHAASGAIEPGAIIRLEDPSQDPLVADPSGQMTYSNTQATLYQVVLHEIGHALGLADDADPKSVMFVASSPQNRSLDQTDVAGIEALYGPRTTSQATTSLTSMPQASGTNRLIQAMATFGPQQPNVELAVEALQRTVVVHQLSTPAH